jgi:hypothetical protein
MPSDALDTLHEVNASLRSALTRLHPERKLCSTITPQDFSGILGQLLRAAECLSRLPATSDAVGAIEIEEESLEYRSNLEKLKLFLPDLHGRLLAERARLESAQSHVAAAASWARSSKKTL